MNGPRNGTNWLDRLALAWNREETVALMARELSVLIQGGVPLARGLDILRRQRKNRHFQQIITRMAERVRSGETFSNALGGHPACFGAVFIHTAEAGETGGDLGRVLNLLADSLERKLRLKRKMQAALIYPVIVLLLSAGVAGMLAGFIVPRFETVFQKDLEGAALPPLTQWVLGACRACRGHWPAGLGMAAAAAAALAALRMSDAGRRFLDGLRLRLPVAGNIYNKALTVRFTRGLGILLDGGAPLLDALRITGMAAGNRVWQEAARDTARRLREGETLAAALEHTGLISPLILGLLHAGEETGQLPEMFARAAARCEEDLDHALDNITALIEPLMIVFLAVVVGIIVLALFLPLVTLIRHLAG